MTEKEFKQWYSPRIAPWIRIQVEEQDTREVRKLRGLIEYLQLTNHPYVQVTWRFWRSQPISRFRFWLSKRILVLAAHLMGPRYVLSQSYSR
jgi:hypothetical protein